MKRPALLVGVALFSWLAAGCAPPPGGPGLPPDAGPPPSGPLDIDADVVPGARCAPDDRLGLVEIASWSEGSYDVSASVFDAPPPWLGPPARSDASCAFFDGAAGCACGESEVCAFGGGCARRPSPVRDLRLAVRAGDDEEVFEEDEIPGVVHGALTLSGPTFSLELSGEGVVVRAPEMTVPEPLVDAAGTLHGGFETPTGLDLSWTPPAAGVDVFTHIPINHHVPTPTFTECLVDGAAGALSVPGEMLTPLAVSTGLEFQRVEPARFAAVTTDWGCIEVRFSVKQLVDLGY